MPGQMVHASITFCKVDYRPRAILKDRCLWKLSGTGSVSSRDWANGWEDLLEMDVIFDFSLTPRVIEKLLKSDSEEKSFWACCLCALASTGRCLFLC